MRILFFLLFFSMGVISLSAQQQYSKVKIDLTQTPIATVAALGLECDHGVYAPGRHLINDFSLREIQVLTDHQIPYEILIEDLVIWYQERSLEGLPALQRDECCGGSSTSQPGDQYETPENYTLGVMGGYHTYTQMLSVLDEMVLRFPDLITQRAEIDTFKTHENRPIFWLSISDNPSMDEGEPEILYTALHHAREANSLSQTLFYMWYLLENYATDDRIKYLVDNTRMYFIPCINPDGYIYNELIEPNGGGSWRKNRRNNGDGNFGVDLNRNYGYLWGIDDVGSSPATDNETYRGPGPFSEPEVQAVAFFQENRNIDITLNCHSFGNLLIRPKVSDPADSTTYVNFGEILSRENNYLFGSALETVGYSVNGDSDSWMYNEQTVKPKIFAMTPEIGPNAFGFWPPQDAIIPLNKSVMSQNLIAANLLLSFVEITDNSPTTLGDLSGNLDFSAKEYGLRPEEQTVLFTSLSNNFEINFSPLSVDLANSATQSVSVPYTFTPTVGELIESVTLVVSVANGAYTRTDTITKQFINGMAETIVTNDNSELADYQTTEDWGLADNTFVSGPTSITDSPGFAYRNDTESEIMLTTPIDLSDNPAAAFLRYWTRWQIEDDYDFAQVMASNDDGNTWTPLCGKFTNLASPDQPEGEQLYDGEQDEWVLEEVNLAAYLGETILIKFYFFSDGFVRGEGFYFDDLSVETYSSIPTSSEDLNTLKADVRVYPTPFNEQVSVSISLPSETRGVAIALLNALGQEVQSTFMGTLLSGRHAFELETSALTNGVYFLTVTDEAGQMKTVKLVK